MWTIHCLIYLFFLLKVITISMFIVFIFIIIVNLMSKPKFYKHGKLKIININNFYYSQLNYLSNSILSSKKLKSYNKLKKRNIKLNSYSDRNNIFVIDFSDNAKHNKMTCLSNEITAILQVADPANDKVLLCLNSPGGAVNYYGLASAQLERIRNANIELIVSVDSIAASGGYMMASIANKIIASPFAILGSIGVVSQSPNFNRLLSDHGIDFELHTAGKHKRTITMFGKNTDEARHKIRGELNVVHDLFKDYILKYRKKLDIDKVSNGDYWFGNTALSLNLIDEVIISSDYLFKQHKTGKYNLFKITYTYGKPSFSQEFNSILHLMKNRIFNKLF